MPEEIQWIDIFNSIGGKNTKDTILRTPPTDALEQRNIDLVTGGFKKANGITRYAHAPIMATGTYLSGTVLPSSETDAWTGSGDATTHSSTGGIMRNDESAGATGFQKWHNAEAGFTTGTDAAYECRMEVVSNATFSGIYAQSICVLDDGTDRFELAAIRTGGVESLGVLTTTGDRTVIGSYSNVVAHDWREMTRYTIAFDASGNVDVFIDNATTASITIAVTSLPASTETSRVAFGSYETATDVVTDWDYIVYTIGASTLTTATITGLFDFEDETGTHHYLMTAGTALYEHNTSTNQWDAVALGTAFTSGAKPHFTVGRESSGGTAICIITTESRDTPQKFDGSSAADLAGSPPSGKYCAMFNDRTFIANTSNDPTAVYYSAIGDSEDRDDGAGTWDTTNDVFLIDRHIFGEITGLQLLGGAQDQGNMLLIFLERGIKRLTGWGEGSLLVETVSADHGCVAPNSIKVGPLGPEQNEGVYFRDTDGYFWTNGQIGNIIRVSQKIGPTIVSDFNATKADQDVAFLCKCRQIVGWSYASGSNTDNDDTIALDYFHGGRPGSDGLLLESWGHYDYEMSSAATFFESSGLDRVVYGTTTGLVYKQNDGTAWDDIDYEGSRETAWFHAGTPHYAKQWRYLTIFTQTVGDFDLTIEWAVDWSDSYTGSQTVNMAGTATFVLGTGVLGVNTLGSGGAIKNRFATNVVANAIKFRVKTSKKAENFVLYGMSLGYQQLDWMDNTSGT